jgi:hypothetical protein
LRAKKRFPKLSVSTYRDSGFLFDRRVRRSLPTRHAVRKYLDDDSRLLYESMYEGIQKADCKQRLHELIEKGPVDEGAKGLAVYYLGDYLLSISSAAAARQAFSSADLYEEAVRPLLEKHPEFVREAVIHLATILVDNLSNELKDKDILWQLSSFCSTECPKLRCLIDDPELSRFLPADQLEVATETLEEATKLYNDDPDLCDYLTATYDLFTRYFV